MGILSSNVADLLTDAVADMNTDTQERVKMVESWFIMKKLSSPCHGVSGTYRVCMH